MLYAGGNGQESQWVFGEVKKNALEVGKGRKPIFQYVLPKVDKVCRKCWILSVGYKNGNNGRVRSAEALMHKGFQAIPPTVSKAGTRLNRSNYARAFVRDFILKYNQGSPVDTYVHYFIFLHTHIHTQNIYLAN